MVTERQQEPRAKEQQEERIAPPRASAHLAKLTEAKVLALERQGRHRYFCLFDEEIALAPEGLMGAAAGRGPRRRTGPPDPELRTVRVCYDHLAGERGGGDSFPAAMATTFRPTERRSSSGWE